MGRDREVHSRASGRMSDEGARLTRVCSQSLRLGVLLAIPLFAVAASATVEIEWFAVDAPRNTCDPQSQGCFGSVVGVYHISKFEITNAD